MGRVNLLTAIVIAPVPARFGRTKLARLAGSRVEVFDSVNLNEITLISANEADRVSRASVLSEPSPVLPREQP